MKLILQYHHRYGCITPFNNVSSSFLLERDYFIQPSASCQLENPLLCQSSANQPVNCPSRSPARWYKPPLPSNYTAQIISNIDCALEEYYSVNTCTYYYCEALLAAEKQAGVIMSIPYLISAGISPMVGFAVDQFGCRAIVATLSPVALIIVHTLLGYTKCNPIPPLVGQGLAYTGFASVLWPSIPLVIEEKYIGFAFGVLTSVLNIGSAVVPILVAIIFTNSNNKYIPHVEILFISMGCFGLMVGIHLNYVDYYKLNSVLNRGIKSNTSNDIDGDMRERLLSDGSDAGQGSWRSIDDEGRQVRGGSFSAYGEVVRQI